MKKQRQKTSSAPRGLGARDLAAVRGGENGVIHMQTIAVAPRENGVIHLETIGVAPRDNGIIHMD